MACKHYLKNSPLNTSNISIDKDAWEVKNKEVLSEKLLIKGVDDLEY